jgi:hypothetical protein
MKFVFTRGDRHIATYSFAVTMLLAACGQPSGTVPARSTFARALTGPPTCNGQRTTKRYGNITVTLKTKGGSFCIPAFGGFGGSMQYPGVKRSVELTIRTSRRNIYDEPKLGSGTSIVYLNLHFHAGTLFRSNLKSKGGLTSQTISAGNAYTAYGIVAVGRLRLMFPPCYTVATQGAYGGVLPNLGDLFRDKTIAGAGYGVIEIYAGEQVSQKC